MSQILFSTDNLALIIAIKGRDATDPGYLLFYSLSNYQTTLSSSPNKVIPNNAILPFSMTPVSGNGLLLTDAGSKGVLTLIYSSTYGKNWQQFFHVY